MDPTGTEESGKMGGRGKTECGGQRDCIDTWKYLYRYCIGTGKYLYSWKLPI